MPESHGKGDKDTKRPVQTVAEPESKYTGIIPVDSLHHFKGSVLLQDVFVESGSPRGYTMIARAGHFITEAMIENFRDYAVQFASVTNLENYMYLKKTGRLDSIYEIPLKDSAAGYDADEIRDDFYKISAEAIASRGLDPKTVNHMMSQLVGISESILNFGQVLSEMRAISNYSEYTYKHSLEVMIISLLLAKQLEKDGKFTDSRGQKRELTQKETMSLAVGAFFHDCGKPGVSWEILEKPGRLSDTEKREMDNHVFYGYEFMKNMVLPVLGKNFSELLDQKMILDIVGGHHWRYDGGEKGYRHRDVDPDNLHPFTFVVGLADATDAMATTRPYQNRRHNQDIKTILHEEQGRQFHPDYVPSMLEVLVDYPENSIAVFRDGVFGVVSAYGRPGEGDIEVEVHGSLGGSSSLEKGSRIILKKEEAGEKIALGVCYYDVMDREVARYVERNPDSDLSRVILERRSGRSFINAPGDGSTSVFIREALGGEQEISRLSGEMRRREEERVRESKAGLDDLVYSSMFNRLGNRALSQRESAEFAPSL